MSDKRHDGRVLYRCRLCNQTYEVAHVPDVHCSLAYAALGIELDPALCSQEPLAPKMFDIHCCGGKGGEYGVADLIGGKVD